MTQKQNDKSKILKKVSGALMAVGAVVFFVGFVLQFISIASTAGKGLFEEPVNYFPVILTGFSLLFAGIMVGAIGTMMQAKDVQESITGTVKNNLVEGFERMRKPAEIYCDYCGTLLHENERDCPNCGAGRTKK